MAGIGWKLEQMLARNSLGSTLQAYLTGVAVTSAPWLLTTAVLVTLRLTAREQGLSAYTSVEHLIAIAYAVTLVLSAPVHVVVSRFTADRLYENRLQLVGGPLWTVLACSLVGFLGIGFATMKILDVPFDLVIPGAMLTSVIAGQWLLLAVGGGMCEPSGVLYAFGSGAALSVACALGLERIADLGVRGYLGGFLLGQAAALTGMIVQVARSLPGDDVRVPRRLVSRAWRDYRLLACSAFAIHAAVWIDKLAVLGLCGGQAAAQLTTVASLAWFTVIPTFAWTYVQVETSFYRAFCRFYRGIESGACIGELEARAEVIRVETARLVRGAITIQVIVAILGLFLAPHVAALLGLAPGSTLALRLCLVAASFQMVTLLSLLMLYYFDLRRDACVVALCQLVGVTLAAVIMASAGGPPALGAALGSVLPALYALAKVKHATGALVRITFQSQPYGLADADAPDTSSASAPDRSA